MSTHGMSGLQRGFVPTAIRDGVWATGYFAGPKDSVVSTITTGIVVAGVSHPFDTIKTRMQSNLDGESFRKIARSVAKEGMRAAFKGASPRAVRVIAALIGMDTVDEACRAVSKK